MKDHYSLHSKKTTKVKGFTLLEVLVVIALIGLIVSVVQFNFSGKKPEDTLKESSYKFAELFESAANYGLLNNIELGLYINKNSYQFLGYDGVKWSEILQQDWLAAQELPEGVTFKLSLNDLPIEEPLLFDSAVFKTKEEEFLSFDTIKEENAKKEPLIFPQVYILSGGDITPFSLTFQFTDAVSHYDDLSELAYRVTGIYSTPLTVEGPVLDD
jgi:general secretion pathway protein H